VGFWVLSLVTGMMTALAEQPAGAVPHSLCVGTGTSCFPTLQRAVNVAHDGDTIVLGAGSYSGGVTIDVSITLQGAGADATIISGGGPVITIGDYLAASEPTVSITGVTITGGLTRSSPVSSDYVGKAGVMALGGGIFIPPAANFATGATVSIADSTITGNVAAPTSSVDAGFSCGQHDCRFAQAGGGGIDSWGTLTLTATTVSNNKAAGPVTSDADGGGVYANEGTLRISNSTVTGNQSIASAPNGRFAEGAGIMDDFSFGDFSFSVPGTSRLSVQNSVVSHNSSVLDNNTLPLSVGANQNGMQANSGGINVGDRIPTSVDNSSLIGNTALATDTRGEPLAIDAAMVVGFSPLTVDDSHVDDNETLTNSLTTADVGPGGSAIELDGGGGTIADTTIDGNLSEVLTSLGPAAATGAVAIFYFGGNGGPQLVTVKNSFIRNNITKAVAGMGAASVQGGGVFNNSLLQMTEDLVSGNLAQAAGSSSLAQGGGIWNGVDLSGPPVQLTLQNSIVSGNILTGGSGGSLQGGGIFTMSPATLSLSHTTVAGNRPDQCFGC
jgi:hypothetical protein